MAVKGKTKNVGDSSTQRYLAFSQIRDNVIIMKDGSARVVLKCSTINFLLKSTEEQDAIIISFQRFLNAINFPVQILVRSLKLDIDKYLASLREKAATQNNKLLQKQTYEYIEYLKRVVEKAQIMKKEFYLIVPYDEVAGESVRNKGLIGIFKNFWASINSKNDILKVRSQIRNFSKLKKGLSSRVNTCKTSLESMGIKAVELDKYELTNLLDQYYNPRLDSRSPLTQDIEKYNIIQ